MQRKSLTIGTHYLLSRERDWKRYTYSTSEVEVLDVRDWRVSGRWGRKDDYEFTTEAGEKITVPGHFDQGKPYGSESCVLVRNVDTGKITVAAPRELKGEWAVAKAQQDAAVAAAREEADRVRAAWKAQQERSDALEDRFKEAFGFEVYTYDGRLTLTLDELETILLHVESK